MVSKIFIYLLIFSVNILGNEILFIDKFLNNDRSLGFSLGFNFLYDNESVLIEDRFERESFMIKGFNFSLLSKRNNISFNYLSNDSGHDSFSVPYDNNYFLFSTNYFFLNKNKNKINYDIYFGYMSSSVYDYNKYTISFGTSKETESQNNILSYYHLSAVYQKSTIGKDNILLDFKYPIYLFFENKFAYIFTPELLLNDKDLYFGASLKFLF